MNRSQTDVLNDIARQADLASNEVINGRPNSEAMRRAALQLELLGRELYVLSM